MSSHSFYNKYIKYKLKYIDLKNKLFNNLIQSGGKIKTFYIAPSYIINNEFIEKFKKYLIKKGWIESSSISSLTNFVYILNSSIRQKYINDSRPQSNLINYLSGKTYDNLLQNNLFIKKYRDEYFIHPYQEISIDNVKSIYKKYILEPLISYNTTDNTWIDYPLTIISTKKEIEEKIKFNKDYSDWIIRDLLTEPVLKNGYRFALNLIIVIKLKPFKVYIYKKKLYTLAKKLYNKDNFYNDAYVRETLPYYLWDKNKSLKENEYQSDILSFPSIYPDNWDKEQTLEMDKLINDIVPILFKSNIDLKSADNFKNGYAILNGVIELYEGLPPMLFGIYTDWYLFLNQGILPGLISILIDNKDHMDFKRVNLDKVIKSSSKKNYKFERQFSYGRSLPPIETNKTFFVNVKLDSPKFHTGMINELIKRGYKESTNFPVDFIFIAQQSTYYRNRFDTKGSKWISLLYGNSKTEISNKILLNKKFEKEDFIISSLYLIQNTPIPNIDESIIRILKPLNGFSGSGITIIKTKKDIELWLKKNEENIKYKEWILQDYLQNPDLKDGLKFHLRVLILVKVDQNKHVNVYISNYKFYITASAKYKNNDWLNKDIHDTHYKSTKKNMIFPEEMPDNWNTSDINKANSDMNQIFIKIFSNQIDFSPEWNAKKGFEIFGADIMFSNKHTYLLEINSKIGTKSISPIIPGIIETVLEGKENKYFTKLI
jgi:hypothetical protein